MSIDKQQIRRRAMELIVADGHRVGTRLAQSAGLSRQVANGYLQALQREGLVDAEGTTRARYYRLKLLAEVERRYPREGLQEDLVWREFIAPVVARLPDNVRNVWYYACTEMINNAIDHSCASEVQVGVRHNALFTEVLVSDEGEGIFVTSRALDSFEIESHHLRFIHGQRGDDAIVQQATDTPGTQVRMRLANDSPRIMREVFDAFTSSEEYTFDKTVVPLHLAQYEGEKLVSRSQAKRV